MKKSEIYSGNVLMAMFMEVPNAVIISAESTRSDYKLRVYSAFGGLYSKKELKYRSDWNWIMSVVDKIESIIGHSVDIDNAISISWWYSPKKTGTFAQGAGGGGGETVKRDPFDSIFGKFYQIHSYFGEDKKKFTFNPKLFSNNKIEALWLACYHFINWYYKIVLKNEKFTEYNLPTTR